MQRSSLSSLKKQVEKSHGTNSWVCHDPCQGSDGWNTPSSAHFSVTSILRVSRYFPQTVPTTPLSIHHRNEGGTPPCKGCTPSWYGYPVPPTPSLVRHFFPPTPVRQIDTNLPFYPYPPLRFPGFSSGSFLLDIYDDSHWNKTPVFVPTLDHHIEVHVVLLPPRTRPVTIFLPSPMVPKSPSP